MIWFLSFFRQETAHNNHKTVTRFSSAGGVTMPKRVKLERIKVAERTWVFNLILSGEVEKTFYLAQIKNGGMTLVNYEFSQNEEQEILSAFFYVNIMGHDLDEWMHFDVETGAQVPHYINPRQRAGKFPERDHIESERDKRVVAKKLRRIVEKWGQEQEINRDEKKSI
jgi:hypothetical protein